MRLVMTLSLALFFMTGCSQQQHFDLASYSAPKGNWTKKTTESTIQFSKEDAAKGDYCLITLYKALPGTASPKENFDMAWGSLVKETIDVTTAPEMQTPSTENGWEAHSGYAPFESEGKKGVVLLVTSSGYEKMVNILVVMNSTVYESELTAFLESISLKKPSPDAKTNTTASKEKPSGPVAASSKGFAFNTTNFDDGWTSVVQEDWVEVTKGNIEVLLHYPKDGTIFPADPEPLINAAWNILVAPRYSNLKNYRTGYVSNYERGYIATGYATDNITHKESLIVFFRQGDTGWMEIVVPDKNSFIQQFKVDPETIRYDTDNQLLKPLVNMVSYNKFAIAAGDFKGSWSSDFTGLQHLYNVYTGNYAGMNINQSNQTFNFGAGGSYSWQIVAVNGMAGSAKFSQAKSAGKFSVLNNWQIKFSDIEGKPKTYNAFFSCIKGARLLKLLDADYPGSGVYTVYGMK